MLLGKRKENDFLMKKDVPKKKVVLREKKKNEKKNVSKEKEDVPN